MLTKSPRLSDQQKRELIHDFVGEDVFLTGQQFSAFSKVVDYIGKVDDTLTFAEFIPAVAATLRSPLIRAVSSGSTFLSIFLFPFDSMIKLINANQTGEMIYAYRGAAYTVSAWAYSQPIPKKSRTVLDFGSILHPTHEQLKRRRREYDAAWTKASSSALGSVKSFARTHKLQEDGIKMVLRALSDGDAGKLSVMLMKGFEDKVPVSARNIYRSNYSTRYPS